MMLLGARQDSLNQDPVGLLPQVAPPPDLGDGCNGVFGILELSGLAKEMRDTSKRDEKLGLTQDERRCCTARTEDGSASLPVTFMR